MLEPLSLSWSLFMALVGGMALGGVFYGGLWWTVRHAARWRHPGTTMLISALLRLATALGGFYVIAAGDWRRMLLCLLGFVAARLAVTWATRLPATTHAAAGEPRHAP